MTLYGYARVSVREPEDKNLDLQVEGLVPAGAELGDEFKQGPWARLRGLAEKAASNRVLACRILSQCRPTQALIVPPMVGNDREQRLYRVPERRQPTKGYGAAKSDQYCWRGS